MSEPLQLGQTTSAKLVAELRKEHREFGQLDTNDIGFLFTYIAELEALHARLNQAAVLADKVQLCGSYAIAEGYITELCKLLEQNDE